MQIDEDVNEEKMSVEKFKAFCNEYDNNLSEVIPKDRFQVRCQKCKSTDVQILYNGKEISCGTPQTGCWTSQDMSLVFKCLKCGNAIGIKE